MGIKEAQTLAPLVILALAAIGCGSEEYKEVRGTQDTACASNSAQILVQDGFQRVLCGCSEGSGTYYQVGETLSCTVSKNTLVVFNFAGTKLQHQIYSAGNPGFATSPLRKANDPTTIQSHQVMLEQAGTYVYQDAFSTGLQGKIIVQ